MAAIISEKFRIFNAKQFLESLTEGTDDQDSQRSKMYFFVGRPQAWDSYLEILSVDGGTFTAGQSVYVGANWGAATFTATISKVLPNSLILSSVGPLPTATPSLGSEIKGYDGSSDTGVTAQSGVYRYSREDVPPVPLDNQGEKYDIYDDIIAAKRISSSHARSVVRKYKWDTGVHPKFDMWKPNYSSTPAGGGQVGITSATGATAIANAKFYCMNQKYEVFKCLYNGESPANASGVNSTHEPMTTPSAGLGTYDATARTFTSPGGEYIWKYLYTIPTDDVLAFLSTDFMPINASGETTRTDTETNAVDGSVDVALVKDVGEALGPNNGTYYAPVVGDGTGGVVAIAISGGVVDTVSMHAVGSGYTYATVPIITGVPQGTAGSTEAIGLFTDSALTSSQAVTPTKNANIEAVLSPQGGHGADLEVELNAKRVMTNIRLTFIENAGDFPVDNDFRRIGIVKDPLKPGGAYADTDTLNGLYAVKISSATGDFIPDETISQTVTGGTAIGQVVSWTLDSGSPTPTPGTPGSGVLKYFQSPDSHADGGVVRAFASDASNTISGDQSASPGTIDVALADGTQLSGCTFTDGLAGPEVKNNSGDLIYIENRRLITRAADQIEDIKLVIEF